MKKPFLTIIIATCAINTFSQNKFDVKDLGDFKLHSYISADPLGDINYIIEGKETLVILEPAAFHENIKEFGDYITKLGKPIEKMIANYHAAGFNAYESEAIVMVEGMPEFEKGEIYSGMMQNFAQVFGDAIDSRPHEPTATIPLNSIQNWAGVTFKFSPGANSDFPAASILIGDKVYYTHFTPAIAHPSPLQITSRNAVDAQLAELQKAKTSRATIFIGGHGMGLGDIKAVDFQITYLKKIKELLHTEKTALEFTNALLKAYPNTYGEENVKAVADLLYR